MVIIRTFHSILIWVIAIVSTVFISLCALVIVRILGRGDEATQPLARGWARLNLFAAGVRVEKEGGDSLDPSAPYIFAGNHASQYDIFVLQGYLGHSFRWMAKKELFQVLLWGPAMRAAGYIPIDRSHGREALKSLGEAARRIAGGTSVVIFPEGTRTRDGSLGEFKAGGMQLAIKAGVPIVPVALRGTYAILPKGRFFVRPGRVRVAVGRPVPVKGMKQKDKHDLAGRVRAEIVELLEKMPEK